MFCVYLANILCGIESRRYQMYYTEDEVLSRFGILSDSAFNELHAELKNSFEARAE